MSLTGREHEWGLVVILASAAGIPLGSGALSGRSVATDRTLLLPTTSRRSDGSPEGRPWLMLKRD